MKKTWIILTLLTLVSYTSISQTDITDSVICLPVNWARQTVIELEERDMFEEQVEVLNEEIHLRDKKIALKDSIINTSSSKEVEYLETINSLKQSINLKETQIDLITKKQKKAKLQRNLIGIASAILTVLTLLTR
mgnify:CR=1 FL=1